MNEKYNVYLVSDSTGETLDRIFLSLKSQFANFEGQRIVKVGYEIGNFSLVTIYLKESRYGLLITQKYQ